MKKIIIFIFVCIALCLTAVLFYSGNQVWKIYGDYKSEETIHKEVMEYKPKETIYEGAAEYKPGETTGEGVKEYNPEEAQQGLQGNTEEVVNKSIVKLQGNYSDTVGWLTIPNTKIDYPFVWYKDNDYYLSRDINGKYAAAGTLFIDYRCKKDFTSQNTIIYGHHMKNGSMFGTLKSFNDKTFFNENRYGAIYLPHDNLTLEVFAYMVVNPATEEEIYNTELSDAYLEYVKQNARHFRDIALTENDKIITLSTCAYEFDNARMVLLAKCS